MALSHTPAHSTHHPDRFEDELTGRSYEVFQDTDAQDPRGWTESEHAALWAYNQPRCGSSTATDKPAGNVAIDAFAHYYDTFDAQKSLALTRRYLAAFRPDQQYSVETTTIRGYSQRDWLDVVVAVADGYGQIADHSEQFRQWAFGDVWFVRPDRGQAMEGIYADGPEEALAQFRAQHETPTFVRTLTLVIEAEDAEEADDVAGSIVSAIHDSDALPTGVRAAVTEPTQED